MQLAKVPPQSWPIQRKIFVCVYVCIHLKKQILRNTYVFLKPKIGTNKCQWYRYAKPECQNSNQGTKWNSCWRAFSPENEVHDKKIRKYNSEKHRAHLEHRNTSEHSVTLTKQWHCFEILAQISAKTKWHTQNMKTKRSDKQFFVNLLGLNSSRHWRSN